MISFFCTASSLNKEKTNSIAFYFNENNFLNQINLKNHQLNIFICICLRSKIKQNTNKPYLRSCILALLSIFCYPDSIIITTFCNVPDPRIRRILQLRLDNLEISHLDTRSCKRSDCEFDRNWLV